MSLKGERERERACTCTSVGNAPLVVVVGLGYFRDLFLPFYNYLLNLLIIILCNRHAKPKEFGTTHLEWDTRNPTLLDTKYLGRFHNISIIFKCVEIRVWFFV
jgi:hypothetical protein